MKKTTLVSSADQISHTSCIDQVVGNILSGWRYDISGLSPAMRTDYEQHLTIAATAGGVSRLHARSMFWLISVSTTFDCGVSAGGGRHSPGRADNSHFHDASSFLADAWHCYSLEAVAVAGLIFSMLLWVLVAIATPLPGFLAALCRSAFLPTCVTVLPRTQLRRAGRGVAACAEKLSSFPHHDSVEEAFHEPLPQTDGELVPRSAPALCRITNVRSRGQTRASVGGIFLRLQGPIRCWR